VARLSNAPADPVERIHLMKHLASQLPHDAEAAIRSWAHTEPQVAEVQKRVDERRLEVLAVVLRPAVGSRRDARTLAMMGMTLLVGLQQSRAPVTRREFGLLFNEFEAVVPRRLTDRAAS